MGFTIKRLEDTKLSDSGELVSDSYIRAESEGVKVLLFPLEAYGISTGKKLLPHEKEAIELIKREYKHTIDRTGMALLTGAGIAALSTIGSLLYVLFR